MTAPTRSREILDARPAPQVEFIGSPFVRLLAQVPHFRGYGMVGSLACRLASAKAGLKVGEIKVSLDMGHRSQFDMFALGAEESETQFLAGRLQSGDHFWDLGANWGYFTAVASAMVGPSGLVVSIEANPGPYRHLLGLVHRSGLSNVLALNFALAHTSGQRLYLNRPWYRADTGGFFGERGKGQPVSTKSLDDLWAELGKPAVRMIKLDVEGLEPAVLQGGMRFLAEGLSDCAQIEVSSWAGKRSGESFQVIYETMRKCGFPHAYLIDDGLTKVESPVADHNVLFTRTELAA